mmetsp:Transcript_15667/g.19552  ORF Transcript_15667/g.19552 Transcript_15667/m.19552 type:complete len:143 (+) Transcript_15667:229-657(+)
MLPIHHLLKGYNSDNIQNWFKSPIPSKRSISKAQLQATNHQNKKDDHNTPSIPKVSIEQQFLGLHHCPELRIETLQTKDPNETDTVILSDRVEGSHTPVCIKVLHFKDLGDTSSHIPSSIDPTSKNKTDTSIKLSMIFQPSA